MQISKLVYEVNSSYAIQLPSGEKRGLEIQRFDWNNSRRRLLVMSTRKSPSIRWPGTRSVRASVWASGDQSKSQPVSLRHSAILSVGPPVRLTRYIERLPEESRPTKARSWESGDQAADPSVTRTPVSITSGGPP